MLLPVQGASLSCIMQNTGSRSIMSVPFPPPLIFRDSLFLRNLFPTLLMTFEVLYDLFSSYLSNLLSHYAPDTSRRGSPRAHPSASPGLQAARPSRTSLFTYAALSILQDCSKLTRPSNSDSKPLHLFLHQNWVRASLRP